MARDWGWILLRQFYLFLFRFRNNRIHGIPISKRTLQVLAEVTWELLCDRPRRISRQKFPKRRRILSIPSKPYSFHSVHSAIGSRMNGMIFRSFRKRNSTQKNTDTVYSEHSYSGIVPKERALDKRPDFWYYCFLQGCHPSETKKFPDFSLTSKQFSLTLHSVNIKNLKKNIHVYICSSFFCRPSIFFSILHNFQENL